MKQSDRRLVLRLAELGWLHNQITQYCENAAASKTLCLMGQGLIVALRAELTEYYRLVANLHSQVRFYHIILIRFSFVGVHTYQCLHLLLLLSSSSSSSSLSSPSSLLLLLLLGNVIVNQ